MMMFNRRSLQKGKRGFTLIELAIVLAVTSLLTAGLWRMMSSGNTQLRDQSTADQHRDLIKAVRGYLASAEGQAIINAKAKFILPVGPCPLVAPNDVYANFCHFLPDAFKNGNATNSYGQGYEIGVWPVTDAVSGKVTSYSFMIQTTGGDKIPDTSGGRISSMIGNDGGFVYSIAACGKPACGAFGTWEADPADYNLTANNTGHVATRTFVGASAELEQPWLARMRKDVPDSDGDNVGDLNTFNNDVQTDMNGSTIYGTYSLDASGTPVEAYDGFLHFLREVKLGRSEANGTSQLIINNMSGCKKDTPTDADCDYELAVNGSAQVSELLSANKLFAGQFIYDTSASSSDIRLKHDIKQIKNSLDKISKINGYTFIMNSGGGTRYGVVAQEVEKAFPELVTEDKDGYKMVDYIGLIGPLVEAVNELKMENERLKQKIESQSGAISR